MKTNTANASPEDEPKKILYGVVSKRRIKGITADLIVKDETDEANQDKLQFAETRVIKSVKQ